MLFIGRDLLLERKLLKVGGKTATSSQSQEDKNRQDIYYRRREASEAALFILELEHMSDNLVCLGFSTTIRKEMAYGAR
jgi:hypothetical protein